MSPSQSRIPTIRYWSRRMAWVLVFCLYATPVIVAVLLLISWLNGVELTLASNKAMALSQMEPIQALFIAVAFLIAFGFYGVPLYYLQQLFSIWARGEVLTRRAASAIKNVGMWVVIDAMVVGLALPAIALGITTWLGRTGWWLEFSTGLDSVLIGGIVHIIGMGLDEAALVAEEAALTI